MIKSKKNLINQHRIPIADVYHSTKGDKQKHKIIKIILALYHQLNRTWCYISFEDMCKCLGFPRNNSGGYSKTGPKKAVDSLVKEFDLIIMEKGNPRFLDGKMGLANTYDISQILINHQGV